MITNAALFGRAILANFAGPRNQRSAAHALRVLSPQLTPDDITISPQVPIASLQEKSNTSPAFSVALAALVLSQHDDGETASCKPPGKKKAVLHSRPTVAKRRFAPSHPSHDIRCPNAKGGKASTTLDPNDPADEALDLVCCLFLCYN